MAAKPDPNNSPCVLGIDAAWTAHQPSGISLVQRTTSGWSCLAVAPSYEAFIAQTSCRAWDPGQKSTGSRPDPSALLHASQQLTGAEVSCVSVDMPLVTTAITGRRAADTAISSRTPRRHCRLAARRLRRPWLPLAHQWQRSGSPCPDRVLSPCGPAGLAPARLPHVLQSESLRPVLEC